MQIPSKKQCVQLIRKMKMLDHIVDHSFQVCRVATFLVEHLKSRQVCLNRNLIQAAALLHDITKTRSFKTQENHALTGGQFLSAEGYPEVGLIVGQHVRLDEYFASDVPTEAEIINYADKRVLHDKVVSLKERMDYIMEKYVKGPEYRRQHLWLRKKSEELEAKLFSFVRFTPEDLNRLFDNGTDRDDSLAG